MLFYSNTLNVKGEKSEVVDFSTIRAGFVYVGPVGDLGWTYAHDEGRNITDNKYDWLTTYTIGPVKNPQQQYQTLLIR